MNPLAKARIQILIGAVLFSTGGAAIKVVGGEEGSFDGWQIACVRALIAGMTVLVLLPAARRNWTWKIVPVGIAYSGALLLFVLANLLTTAASTIFLQSAAPLYILLLGPLVLKEPIRFRDVVIMVVMAAGMALFFLPSGQPAQSTAPDPLKGNVLAIVSGMCMAVLFTGLRWFAKREGEDGGHAAAAIVVGSLILFLCTLPMTFPWPRRPLVEWLVLVYLGVFQIGLAYLLISRAMRQVPAFEASLLILIEPVLNPIWTWLIHGENPGMFAVLGGVVIIAAVGFRSLRQGAGGASGH